jgi:N6-L-threonylcarbamoyladenine synthase
LIVLGIETSCDETSIALYRSSIHEKSQILASLVSSQISLHSSFGGVVPEIASRNHLIKLKPLFTDLLIESGIAINEIDLIGVTNRPGLIGALLTGVAFAKALGYSLKKPVIGINHLLGHTLSAELTFEELSPPYFSLIISGGHTHLFHVDNCYNFTLIAKTVDDALGEAFDKIARMLNLGYPGGPIIEKLSYQGDCNSIIMPIAMKDSPNFSFSGLKTFIKMLIDKKIHKEEDIAASFQHTAAKTLHRKIKINQKKHNIKKLIIAGGVAANSYIKNYLTDQLKDIKIFIPPPRLCTDNAEMIAYAAYKLFNKRNFMGLTESAYDKLSPLIL